MKRFIAVFITAALLLTASCFKSGKLAPYDYFKKVYDRGTLYIDKDGTLWLSPLIYNKKYKVALLREKFEEDGSDELHLDISGI